MKAAAVFAFCSLVCATLLWSGTAGATWRTLGPIDGLESIVIPSMLEDSSGNLWFGTIGFGVFRYDGAVFTKYSSENGLVWDEVHAILEDSSGRMWFGTTYGASGFDGRNWIELREQLYQRADLYVHAIAEDAAGDIWFGTERGAARYDGRGLYSARIISSRKIYSIVRTKDNALWFGSDLGAYRFKDNTWTAYRLTEGLINVKVHAILEDSSGKLWFGTEGGVSRYDGQEWTSYTADDGLANENVSSLAEDLFGNVWIGTENGASRFDGYGFINYNTEDGLSRERILSIVADQTGNVWFGTHSGGASMYDGSSLDVYEFEWGLARGSVEDISEDSLGNLWFGASGGAARYDGQTWTVFTTEDGLPHGIVRCVVEDNYGNMWFGTGLGVCRYDGTTMRTFTTEDGLVNNVSFAALVDQGGDVWFGTVEGITRFDGTTWTNYNTSDGLPGDFVLDLYLDEDGRVWVATFGGVGLYDGSGWTSFTEQDGLPAGGVLSVKGDGKGNIWVGLNGNGAAKYDGVSWQLYTSADGLLADTVHDIEVDRRGNVWFATIAGASRFDGQVWGALEQEDGLPNNLIRSVHEDRSGALWFGHYQAPRSTATRHEPDVVPPQTVISPMPLSLTTSNTIHIAYKAAFGEVGGVLFSHRFDGSQWSEWSQAGFYLAEELVDGKHVFEVRSSDQVGNIDPTPAVSEFEIDTTPPSATIFSPAFGEIVKDTVEVYGTAADLRFKNYVVEARESESSIWSEILRSEHSMAEGTLASWNTLASKDGVYELRLTVVDSLGMAGTDVVRVVVDNVEPWNDETAPAVVSAIKGGDVYTTVGDVHLYFPPRAFGDDTQVTIVAPAAGEVPDTLSCGAHLAKEGYRISWGEMDLVKPGVLEMAFEPDVAEDLSPTDIDALALFVYRQDSTWKRVGGTIDTLSLSISSHLPEPGVYALYVEQQVVDYQKAISGLSITPRVFSPTGGFADTEAAIGFTLGRPSTVAVKIYNRAGRLVSEVVIGGQMKAGANLVHWDGRGGDGEPVKDGVYLVTVEANGQTQTKPLAVVR